jgi:hypothetical protein
MRDMPKFGIDVVFHLVTFHDVAWAFYRYIALMADDRQGVFCNCRPALECMLQTAQTAKNLGRRYYNCPARSCNFFKWEDEDVRNPVRPSLPVLPAKKRPLPDEFADRGPTLKRCKADLPQRIEPAPALSASDIATLGAQMLHASNEMCRARSQLEAAAHQVRCVHKLLVSHAENRGILVGPSDDDTQPLDEMQHL